MKHGRAHHHHQVVKDQYTSNAGAGIKFSSDHGEDKRNDARKEVEKIVSEKKGV